MTAATHTPGPWAVSEVRTSCGRAFRIGSGEMLLAGKGCCIIYDDYPGNPDNERAANARLIAKAPETAKQRDGLMEALKQIRLWLAEEGCEEPLELADSALRAAGVTDVACSTCHGYGEWDEGPLPARSSAQIDPEYRQVKCPDCGATGRVPLTAKESA